MTITAETVPAPLEALIRHFTDLRDGDHFGHITRTGKESAFAEAVEHLDGPALQVLAEINEHLLAGTGRIDATGWPPAVCRLPADYFTGEPHCRAQGSALRGNFPRCASDGLSLSLRPTGPHIVDVSSRSAAKEAEPGWAVWVRMRRPLPSGRCSTS